MIACLLRDDAGLLSNDASLLSDNACLLRDNGRVQILPLAKPIQYKATKEA
jgi:hypothetical protein